MIDILPELYRLAAIQPITAPTLESRSRTINTILSKKKIDWFLNCIRMCLNKPIESDTFKTEFIKLFKDEDKLFFDSDNGLELNVLAIVILIEYLNRKKEKSNDRVILALSVITARFGTDDVSKINERLFEIAAEFLKTEGKFRRTNKPNRELNISEQNLPTTSDVSTIVNKFNDLSKQVLGVFSTLEKNDAALKRWIFILEEESDFHWWLFNGYSSVLGSKISDLSVNIATIAIAYEMQLLTKILPMPVNFAAFFKKAFSEVQSLDGKNMSIRSTVETMFQNYPQLVTLLSKLPISTYGNLVPLLFGLSKAIDTNGDPAWTVSYEFATGNKSLLEYSSFDISCQLYTELLIISADNYSA